MAFITLYFYLYITPSARTVISVNTILKMLSHFDVHDFLQQQIESCLICLFREGRLKGGGGTLSDGYL